MEIGNYTPINFLKSLPKKKKKTPLKSLLFCLYPKKQNISKTSINNKKRNRSTIKKF